MCILYTKLADLDEYFFSKVWKILKWGVEGCVKTSVTQDAPQPKNLNTKKDILLIS